MLTHIPGVANIKADALSRLFAPSPKRVPAELVRVSRAHPPPRDEGFYLVTRRASQPFSASRFLLRKRTAS
eukprot:8843711-Alexandrium_andersonii.AAC.1